MLEYQQLSPQCASWPSGALGIYREIPMVLLRDASKTLKDAIKVPATKPPHLSR